MENNCVTEADRKKLERYKKTKKGFATAKSVVSIVGGVATVIMIAVPMDGPAGDIIAAAATGIGLGTVVAAEAIYDNVVDIPNPETDVNQNIDNIAQNTQVIADNAQKVIASVQKYQNTQSKSL